MCDVDLQVLVKALASPLFGNLQQSTNNPWLLGAGYGKFAVNDEGGNTTDTDAVNLSVLLADVIHVFTRIKIVPQILHIVT